MSKSLGNSLTIRDALKMYNYEVIKYLLLSNHYTSDIDIKQNDFRIAEGHLYYFYNTIKKMQNFIKQNNGIEDGDVLEDKIASTIISDFIGAMEDDFNSAKAIASLHTVFKYANNIMEKVSENNIRKTANTLSKILKDIKEVYAIFGLFEQVPDEFISELKEKYMEELGISKQEIEDEIIRRADAKQNKNYKVADEIRASLEEKGIILKDTKDGTLWDLKELF